MKATIVPLENRILIQPIEEQVRGGIIRPETAEKKRPSKGKVIAIGKEYTGVAKKGDTVFFQKYGPEELIIEKLIYYVASPEDVLAVIA